MQPSYWIALFHQFHEKQKTYWTPNAFLIEQAIQQLQNFGVALLFPRASENYMSQINPMVGVEVDNHAFGDTGFQLLVLESEILI
jgi:hypothetical protein